MRIESKFSRGSAGAFADAAAAWFWSLECLDARATGAHCSRLRAGRPCEPDDVVIAMSRLQLPPVPARNVVAWGRKRTAPPEGSDARRLWDEAMGRLAVVLRAKGIVRSPAPTVFELMDLPLAYLASISGELEPSAPAPRSGS